MAVVAQAMLDYFIREAHKRTTLVRGEGKRPN
jgi:hypothetical protein